MKLSDITNDTKLEFEGFKVGKSKNMPFWDVYIEPVNNPFGLFSFTIHERNERTSYSCFMYKTSYYTNPVISKSFGKDAEIEDVVKWVRETLIEIKTKL